MKTMENGVPARVTDEAIAILSAQRATPVSPGRLESGQPCVCAAGAVAVAALRVDGDCTRAELLRRDLCISKERERVRDVFLDHGWSVGLCDAIFGANDAYPESSRTVQAVSLLKSLQ